MSRKIIQEKLSKTKIEEKQELISQSVNVSQGIKDKLDAESKQLMIDVKMQRDEQSKALKDTDRIIKERDIKNDELIKVSVDCKNLGIAVSKLKIEEESKIKGIKKLEKEYNIKNEKLISDYNVLKNRLDKEIIASQKKSKKIKEDNNLLLDEKKSLLANNKDLLTDINTSKLTIDTQTNNLLKLKKEQDKINSDIKTAEATFEAIESVIDSTDKKKVIQVNELSELSEQLQNTNNVLKEAKTELEKTKETNLVLIKREEKLNSKEKYINEYYQKAGLPIN